MKLDVQMFGGRGATSENTSQTFSDRDIEAIENYQLGENYELMNGYLRDPSSINIRPEYLNDLKSEISELDRAINKSLNSMTLYRVVEKNMYFNGDNYKSMIGKEFTEKGFMSTSTDVKVLDTFAEQGGLSKDERVYIQLKTSRKNKGADFSKIKSKTFNNTQKEVLLARNTSYKIYNAEKKNGIVWLYAKTK